MKTLLNPLHLACQVNDDRPNQRLIEIKRGIASATNGIMMVRIDLRTQDQILPEQIELLDGKYIDMEVWKDIHNADKVTFTDDQIHCEKLGIGKYFDYSLSQGEFFNMDSILIDLKNKDEQAKTFTRYNVKQIEILRKIFDQNELTFAQSSGQGSGTLIYPDNHSGMFAYLMPVVLEPNQSRYFFLT